MNHNNHASGTREKGQVKMPVYPVLSNNRNITGNQSIREAQILTVMQDVFTGLVNPFPPRIKNIIDEIN
jgi:hypothetical protein